ncbi:hypothetical protein [Arthrobacter sp. UYCo732]|uniref:hypothetical protein n=1 Tax=Arthrobacter sp. UYCo732 TaxID=3156336 RepID=UPI00339A21C2
MADTENDALRKRLTSLRLQIPTWLTVALLLTAIVTSTWTWLTGDNTAGWISIASTLLFMVAALTLEKLMSRLFRDHYNLKGNNG